MRIHPLIPGAVPLLVAALGGGCRSAPLPAATAQASTLSHELSWSQLSLGPGDLLRVSVFGHPELSTPYGGTLNGTRIDADGLLSLPLAGTVAVGGQSISQARATITDALARYVQEPRIDVAVVEYAARRFYLYGEVNKPGAYVLDRPLDVYQALALGGGYTPRARRDQVVLLRGRPDNLEVEVIDGESPEPNGMIALRPDDFLFVRRSGAGRFSDEVLPILTGISSSLGSVATLILIDDRVNR